ncbi:MAG TPA: ABC transporter ATP-binding protein [Longimicrobiales bacterium]|nr:ABC transporter ATP-binding protein [Longimicrobiales bacterium]
MAAPLAHHEEEALGKAYDARLMRRLLRYLQPYRARVFLAIALLLLGALVELAGPWITMIALDEAIPAGDRSLLLILAAAYFASLLLAFALQYAQTLLTTWLGQSVMYDLRREIFGKLQRLEIAFFDRNPVGRLMTRVTSDVEVLNELFSSGVVTVFGDVFTLLMIVAAMAVMDWRLALVTLAVMPFVMVAAMLFRARIRNAYRDIRVRLARINAYLQEHISGMTVIQLFRREEESASRFRDIDRHYLQAHLRSITYYALFFPIIELLTAISLATIIVYGGGRMLDGAVTVGVIAAFLQYARRFFRPIQDLSEKYNMLQGAMASSERIFKLVDTPERARPEHVRTMPADASGRIEFRNVWFAYRRLEGELEGEGDWDWVLRDISFTAQPGERIAIVGHTGAGKTSLVNLLMRFYEPQRGQILFDGVPIAEFDPLALRERIGLVLQDVFLFSRDVAYNIRLGRDDIDDEAVRAAAERVGATAMIERLPAGFAQALGERGASISVGERQLLSFARALAFDPLVLVLDEATSSVDSALEERIDRALDELMRGRTSLVIAHRLSTVQNADRVLVLRRGTLCEQGTHDELLRHDGLYSRLYELQFAASGATAHLAGET